MQAQGFDLATATMWTSELLGEFCSTAGFKLGFVPDEALLVPPQKNVFVKHHELENPPEPLGSVDADAFAAVPDQSAEVTSLFRRSVLIPSESGFRVAGGGLGLQWRRRRRAMRQPRAAVRPRLSEGRRAVEEMARRCLASPSCTCTYASKAPHYNLMCAGARRCRARVPPTSERCLKSLGLSVCLFTHCVVCGAESRVAKECCVL